MRILVDADACPVKKEVVQVAKDSNIEVLMFADTAHIIEDDYSKTVVVEKGKDSVDIALINKVGKGDIVVTQDYGVAAMALGKDAMAINNSGMVYSDSNIDRLLFERHLSSELRRRKKSYSKHKKRNSKNNEEFKRALKKLCLKA